MRKYKKLTHINRLQQKIDQKYGKGKFHAVFVLGLFLCLFFTSCQPDAPYPGTGSSTSTSSSGASNGTNSTNNGTTSTVPTGAQEGTTHTGQTSNARIIITNSGQTVTMNNPPYGDFPAVLDAYFARKDEKSGEYKKIDSASIGDMVYIVVDTVNLMGKTIQVTIKDKSNIITGNIPFMQHKSVTPMGPLYDEFSLTPEDVGGIFEAKVRNADKDKRFALYKITLKAKDDETTKKWKEDIQKHTDKKLQLSLTVNVTDAFGVIYCGSNSSTDVQKNVWLNQEGKWFTVGIGGCFCGKHYFEGDWLKGDNVIHSRKDSKVKAQGEQQKPIGIILHRLEGWDTSGGIQKSIGTHFFIDKPFRDRKNIDGEIFQPVPLNKYTGHILNPTNNARKGYPHSNLTSQNTIGIEVAGMTYHKDGDDYTLASKDDKGVYRVVPASDRQPLTEGWKRKSDGKVFYWDQLTEAQIKSTACLVKLLMDKYSLSLDDIYAHEDIQSKSAGEGGVVKEAIMPYLKGEKKI